MRTKFENKLKNKIIRDGIKTKIQFEKINVNKTIANKRRENESKKKINWRADMNLCMVSIQSEKQREGRESVMFWIKGIAKG